MDPKSQAATTQSPQMSMESTADPESVTQEASDPLKSIGNHKGTPDTFVSARPSCADDRERMNKPVNPERVVLTMQSERGILEWSFQSMADLIESSLIKTELASRGCRCQTSFPHKSNEIDGLAVVPSGPKALDPSLQRFKRTFGFPGQKGPVHPTQYLQKKDGHKRSLPADSCPVEKSFIANAALQDGQESDNVCPQNNNDRYSEAASAMTVIGQQESHDIRDPYEASPEFQPKAGVSSNTSSTLQDQSNLSATPEMRESQDAIEPPAKRIRDETSDSGYSLHIEFSYEAKKFVCDMAQKSAEYCLYTSLSTWVGDYIELPWASPAKLEISGKLVRPFIAKWMHKLAFKLPGSVLYKNGRVMTPEDAKLSWMEINELEREFGSHHKKVEELRHSTVHRAMREKGPLDAVAILRTCEPFANCLGNKEFGEKLELSIDTMERLGRRIARRFEEEERDWRRRMNMPYREGESKTQRKKTLDERLEREKAQIRDEADEDLVEAVKSIFDREYRIL